MEFQTDLNHRERTDLAKGVSAAYEAMGKLKVALETADDKELMISFLMVSFSWMSVSSKLGTVLKDTADVEAGKSDLDEFKGF